MRWSTSSATSYCNYASAAILGNSITPDTSAQELVSIRTFAVVNNSEKQKRSHLDAKELELRPKLVEGESCHTDVPGCPSVVARVRFRKTVDISELDPSPGAGRVPPRACRISREGRKNRQNAQIANIIGMTLIRTVRNLEVKASGRHSERIGDHALSCGDGHPRHRQ